jgi:hypothetical protein
MWHRIVKKSPDRPRDRSDEDTIVDDTTPDEWEGYVTAKNPNASEAIQNAIDGALLVKIVNNPNLDNATAAIIGASPPVIAALEKDKEGQDAGIKSWHQQVEAGRKARGDSPLFPGGYDHGR